MPGAEPPLAGRSVLVTRAPDAAVRLVALLRALGARAEARATIAFEAPLDPEPARGAARELRRYAWVVFTSVNGVERFVAMCAGEGLRGPGSTRVAAVGPATARALAAAGWPPDVVAERADGAGLARELVPRLGAGERVLLVRPEKAAEALAAALEAARIPAEQAIVYRTVAAPGAAEVAEAVSRGRYDAAVFTAPSTLEWLLQSAGARIEALRSSLAAMALVAIGETTASAIRAAGLPVAATADEPTDEAIAQALERALAG